MEDIGILLLFSPNFFPWLLANVRGGKMQIDRHGGRIARRSYFHPLSRILETSRRRERRRRKPRDKETELLNSNARRKIESVTDDPGDDHKEERERERSVGVIRRKINHDSEIILYILRATCRANRDPSSDRRGAVPF